MIQGNTRAWMIWCAAIAYYFYQYVVRLSPAVMVADFSHDFHISAMTYGLISSYYFYSYTLMSVPAGVIMDKVGTKYPMLAACALLSLSCFLFDRVHSDSIIDAELLRITMGVGSAFAFVGVLRLCAYWFHEEKFPMMCGLTNAMGMLAGFISSGPLALIEQNFGWRNMYYFLAICGCVVCALIWGAVKEKPSTTESPRKGVKSKGALRVLSSPFNWYMGVQGGFFVYPVAGFGALWGEGYLVKMYQIPLSLAAELVGLLFMGALLGTVFLGWLMVRVKAIKYYLSAACALLGLIVSYCMIFIPVSIPLMSVLVFFLGVYTAGQVIIYVLAKEQFSKSLSGMVVGLINTLLVGLSALSQPLMGMLISKHWTGETLHGNPVYQLSDFSFAMSSIPVICALNLVMSILYCRYQQRVIIA